MKRKGIPELIDAKIQRMETDFDYMIHLLFINAKNVKKTASCKLHMYKHISLTIAVLRELADALEKESQ